MCENNVPNVHEVVLHLGYTPPLSPNQHEQLPKKDSNEEIDGFVEDLIEEIVQIENVTVKFRISETQTIAQVYPNRLSIADIKKDIARKFEVDVKILCLKQAEHEVCDACLLLETESDEFGIHEFSLELILDDEKYKQSIDEDEHEKHIPKLDLKVYYDKQRLPDFITVHIPGEDTEDGNPKDLVVEIQNKAIAKPYLCGYRDKTTGIEYLNAFTQTGPYFDKWKYRRYYSRDTQTFEHKKKLVDTMHDQTSQCFLDGNNVLFVSDCTNFTIVPRKYQTAAQKMRLENKLAKIKLIQRNWRRYLAVRYMKNAAKEYRRLVANRIAEEEAFKKQTEERISRAERAKQFPRTKDDFDLLYSEVARWKLAELKRISNMYEGAARIAEVNLLLDKEIQLLNGINRQRTIVFKAMEDFRNEHLLEKLGKPINWIGYKDTVIHLDLLRTQRVRFLFEIYRDLKQPRNKEDRLELLRKVKEVIVNEQDYPEFPKLYDLIEREKNLLIYTKHCDVEVLRQRQLILFMELIKFSKEHTPEKVAKSLCTVCRKVKPYEMFALRTQQSCVDTCKKCYDMKVITTEKTIYNAILRAIQREERKKRCNSSYAFVMQIDDIRYLLERIWHSHSILSKNTDLASLRLPRWNKSEDWSPWNCICLTEAEARDHYKITDLKTVYDHKLLLEVDNRHNLGRAAFHKLAAVATEFVEIGQWWQAGMNKQRTVKLMPTDKETDQGNQHCGHPVN